LETIAKRRKFNGWKSFKKFHCNRGDPCLINEIERSVVIALELKQADVEKEINNEFEEWTKDNTEGINLFDDALYNFCKDLKKRLENSKEAKAVEK